MNYNFDEIINRENTNCVKYDLRKNIFGRDDIIPMWVADMDFKTPDFIFEAIKERLNHQILGYSIRSEGFYNSIINWQKTRHNHTVKKEWIAFSPGVVPAISLCIQAFTQPGDKVIVQPPVYFPFFSSTLESGRQLIYNPLKIENNQYTFDFENLEKQIDSRTKMLLLSSPHNPVGRVWQKSELERLAEICLKNNILIIADEIHCDLVFHNFEHIPFATISEQVANNTITCIAPSKTFNMAGMATSALIISNPALLTTYNNLLQTMHIGGGNIFGSIALESAFTHGQKWLRELMNYLKTNLDLLQKYISQRIPEIEVVKPQATYLVWLNCKGLGLNDEQLTDFMINKAGLALNAGTMFGQGGSGFQRMNIACPKESLINALQQLESAVYQYLR